jgi:hypothetical protein
VVRFTPQPFATEKNTADTHWMGLRDGLDALEKKKILAGNRNLVVQAE